MTSAPTHVNTLFERMREYHDREACFWHERGVSYSELLDLSDQWSAWLREQQIGKGDIVGILADYSPQSIALVLALMRVGAISMPISFAAETEIDHLIEIAGAGHLVRIDADDKWEYEPLPAGRTPPLVEDFRSLDHPGLIVFTSGSTGKPKGILHDCDRLLLKFATVRTAYRTLLFLLFDHFGGFNTLLGVLSYGGTMVLPKERTARSVGQVISTGRVDLLPVTPTFLNLLIASGTGSDYDVSSVKLVTYGTEVMPPATLKAAKRLFPDARLQQTYGLSELGVLHSKSRDSESLWVKIGGKGFETRVIHGTLQIRSEAAMLGYLNAPSPFDADGWFDTGDQVEQDGEYFRVLGRESEIINVGGQKVFPAEVETVLLEAPNVDEAMVYGEKHPLMGAVPMAQITLHTPEDATALRARLRGHCLAKLASYKVPIRFSIADVNAHDARFKKLRPNEKRDRPDPT
jgi:acyl-CoA synthetase (AMP-forming)/AMP-acid ligase II